MKSIKYITLISIMLFLSTSAYAFDKEQIEHRIVAGFSLGATAPAPIPREIRKVTGWWPQFTPQLGYNVIYNPHKKWGVGSGIVLDYKGMGAKADAKYIHTRVRLSEGGEELEGYFVGTNKTTVKLAYVTIPLFARYKITEKWHLRAGGYASYAFSTSFEGEVYDGYLRTPDPTGEKIVFEEGDKATYDFGSDIRSFDFGVLLGGEMKVNNRFNIYGNMSWGLRPVFKKDFKAMDFKMYNIYFTMGLAYRL